MKVYHHSMDDTNTNDDRTSGPFVVVIRGPLGSGKTTIAKELARALSAKHIAIDTVLSENGLDHVGPDDPHIPLANFLRANVLVIAIARAALQRGKSVIVDGNFYLREALDDLLAHLPPPHHVFTLRVPVEMCIARDAARGATHGPDAARAVHALTTRFDAGTIVDNVGDAQSAIATIQAHLDA